MLHGEGQMSDYKGAELMINALPSAKQLLGDKGYDANWFRQALAARGITACIPSKSNRATPIEHDRFSIANGSRSKIRSAGSRTGGASTPATIDALTPSSRLSASQQPSSSGSDQ
jgi:hypothetical protein